MDAEAQQRALRAPSRGPCVIVSTNVAETSLTIPGITAVIDSGLARIASFSAQRDMNTLYLGSISLANAVQRAGRAGRTAPGVCIRLWSPDRERGMAPSLDPEALRVEPTSMLLSLHALLVGRPARLRPGLPGRPLRRAASAAPALPAPGYRGRYLVDWLTEPAPDLWEKAERSLRRIGAVVGRGELRARSRTLGREIARFPAHPVLARVLLDAERAGAGPVAAAMVAILESQARRTKGASANLYALGADLASDPEARHWDRDTREGYKQLLRLLSRGPRRSAPGPGRGAGSDGGPACRRRRRRPGKRPRPRGWSPSRIASPCAWRRARASSWPTGARAWRSRGRFRPRRG